MWKCAENWCKVQINFQCKMTLNTSVARNGSVQCKVTSLTPVFNHKWNTHFDVKLCISNTDIDCSNFDTHWHGNSQQGGYTFDVKLHGSHPKIECNGFDMN